MILDGQPLTSMPLVESLSVTLMFEPMTFKIPKDPFLMIFGLAS